MLLSNIILLTRHFAIFINSYKCLPRDISSESVSSASRRFHDALLRVAQRLLPFIQGSPRFVRCTTLASETCGQYNDVQDK